jgi:membrane fusion protein, multidrug efflux system
VRQSGKVEVIEGLAAGDLVVTAGQSRVMRGDGLPLRVVNVDKPGARPAAPAGGASGSAPAPRIGAPA